MPGRPLTILQLTHQGGASGSTVAVANLSRLLARRGHRVLIGCRPGTMLADRAREAGLELVPLDFRRLGPLAAALGEVIARERVDVANSNATRDRRALTWLRWRRRLPVPFVVTRHTMPLTSPAELIAVGLSADRTIAVSPAVALALRRRLHPRARRPGRPGRSAGGARTGAPQGPAHPAAGPRGFAAGGPGRLRRDRAGSRAPGDRGSRAGAASHRVRPLHRPAPRLCPPRGRVRPAVEIGRAHV